MITFLNISRLHEISENLHHLLLFRTLIAKGKYCSRTNKTKMSQIVLEKNPFWTETLCESTALFEIVTVLNIWERSWTEAHNCIYSIFHQHFQFRIYFQISKDKEKNYNFFEKSLKFIRLLSSAKFANLYRNVYFLRVYDWTILTSGEILIKFEMFTGKQWKISQTVV